MNQNGRILTPNTTYFGRMDSNGVPHGRGRMILGIHQEEQEHLYKQGDSITVLDGEWNEGKLDGCATVSNSVDGQAKFSYHGKWFQGARQGFGMMIYMDGTRYHGFYQEGKKHGLGMILWSNGDSFFGYFKHGKPKGLGEAKFSDGSTYVGYFEDRLLNGLGVVTLGLSGEVFSGIFDKGKIVDIYSYLRDGEEQIFHRNADDEEDIREAYTDSEQEEERLHKGLYEPFMHGMRSPTGRPPKPYEEGKHWEAESDEEDLQSEASDALSPLSLSVPQPLAAEYLAQYRKETQAKLPCTSNTLNQYVAQYLEDPTVHQDFSECEAEFHATAAQIEPIQSQLESDISSDSTTTTEEVVVNEEILYSGDKLSWNSENEDDVEFAQRILNSLYNIEQSLTSYNDDAESAATCAHKLAGHMNCSYCERESQSKSASESAQFLPGINVEVEDQATTKRLVSNEPVIFSDRPLRKEDR